MPTFAAYYAHVPSDDLADRDREQLTAVALAHRELAHRRTPGEAIVRVHAPKKAEPGWDARHTVVQIVNDDMPFLVDSVTMELDRHDLGLHLVVHPILRVRRDADGTLVDVAATDAPEPAGEGDVLLESFLYIEVDRETDPEVLAGLEHDLHGILDDVRAATEDWLKMLARLRHVVDEVTARPPPIDPDDLAEATALLAWMGDQHFTFLGTRTYDLVREHGEDVLRAVEGSGLGILRGGTSGPSQSFAQLPPAIRAHARANAHCSCSPRRTAVRRCTGRPTSTTSASGGSATTAR